MGERQSLYEELQRLQATNSLLRNQIIAERGESRVAAAVLRKQITALNKRERERKRVRTKPVPVWALPILDLPEWMLETAKEVVTDPSMRDTARHVLGRCDEFRSKEAAALVAIGMDLRARQHFDRMLDKHWAKVKNGSTFSYREVVVGAGLHAAVYAATRARMGKPRVLVVEKTSHPGGVFACSRGPGFYLNSRNRPGNAPSRPGDIGALNFLPGCIIQPADMGSAEYQSNDVIAWVIRANLAMFADVLVNYEVGNASAGRSIFNVSGRKNSLRAIDRIILTTGFGGPNGLVPFQSDRYLTFEQFMARMDKPFPLKGATRVCVLGAGDAGKCVIEALTGQGPQMLTSASLDYPRIDWYGVPEGQRTRQGWENCNRTRYKGIGALLTDENFRNDMPRVFLGGSRERPKCRTLEKGIDCVYVDGKPYDLVIQCTGYMRPDRPVPNGPSSFSGYMVDSSGSSIAGVNSSTYTAGPCAKIQASETDRSRFRSIGENGTSIFYLARKTEALALSFT